LWKTIPLLILNDSFAEQSILGLKLFSFIPQYTLLHALLAFMVSVEKWVIILMGYLIHYLFFSLTAFNILSLISVLIVLMIICHGEVVFWSSLFGVLEAF
jgi:hypothetical protein